MIYSKDEDKGGNLMGKKILSTLLVLLVITGCSQNTDKNGISGQKSSLLKQTLEEEKQQTADNEHKEDDKEKSDDEIKAEVETNQSAESENKPARKEITKAKPKNSNDSSERKTEHSSDDSTTVKPYQPQKPTQPQEPSQPSKPAEPTPDPPHVCNDIIPAGAYTDEAEMDRIAQKKVMDSVLNGGQGVSGYEVEYGYTECGTKYCIPIYY